MAETKKYLIKKNKKIRLIELFGGIGTQSMALERMGVPFEHYKLVEFDKYPVASYNAIHETSFKPQDITKTHIDDLAIADKEHYQYICTYSFPCTDISVAGHMAGMSRKDWLSGNSTRSGLLWEFERILNEAVKKGTDEGNPQKYLPDILVMENVTQVHNKKNLKDFKYWLGDLEQFGYISKYADLNAKDFGVPQNRNRCFCVSWLDKDADFEFPKSIPLGVSMDVCLQPEEEVESRYYIKGPRADDLINQLIERYGEDLEEMLN